MKIQSLLPKPWQALLNDSIDSNTLRSLDEKLAEEVALGHRVFPEPEAIFKALALVPPERTRVVILGQDPYHGENQATGLSFAVPNSLTPKPPSLKNILKELASDLGITPHPLASDLTGWAHQGVLLLNTTLTVRAHEPLSHQDFGWEVITDAILSALNTLPEKRVVVLWGGHAKKKKALFDPEKTIIFESAHPSPLSAYRGFLGSKIFSKINAALIEIGQDPIRWEALTLNPPDAS